MTDMSPNDDSAWMLSEQEPTGLVALWGGEDAPTRTEVMAALSSTIGREIEVQEELEDEDDGEMIWGVIVDLPKLSNSVAIWVEPAKPEATDGIEDPAIVDARWALGMETLLAPRDPLTEFITLMRTLAGAFPDVPAILDLNTTIWFPRRDLDDHFLTDDVEPPADLLWVVHVVAPRDESRGAWLHTHGLWRCGQPELEMIDVPMSQAGAAGDLLNDIAALILEYPPAEPGEPFEIGSGLEVRLERWEDATANLPEVIPGSLADRQRMDMDAHVGARAVVCSTIVDAERPWRFPDDVIAQLERDEAVVYRTRRATERQARLARSSWDQLATAFAAAADVRKRQASAKPDERLIAFLVKVGFQKWPEEDDGSREHLWFDVSQFEAERAEGELVNQPLDVPTLTRGDVVWFDRESISDWQVLTPYGSFGPSSIAAVWRAIDELRAQNGTGPAS